MAGPRSFSALLVVTILGLAAPTPVLAQPAQKSRPAVLAKGAAPESLGIFDSWGAFRQRRARHCYAIARPAARVGNAREPAPTGAFASFGFWPAARIRGQFYVRLSRPRRDGTDLSLTIDGRRFVLVGNGVHGWAADARMDAAIIAAVRSATTLSVSSAGRDGRAIADAYRLRGAATAIDAAALGCAGLAR